ncbi:MAG: hypothetical protein HFG57_09730 [Lachnospiraceae bacterium]|nr:hypothetical protein [Lachnospiraceae bacterium]
MLLYRREESIVIRLGTSNFQSCAKMGLYCVDLEDTTQSINEILWLQVDAEELAMEQIGFQGFGMD